MENKKHATNNEAEKDIILSRMVKAGKRIYYIDVKKNNKNDMYIALTESKKVFRDDKDALQVSFEKHKIFLYREDFGKFVKALTEAVEFVETQQGAANERPEEHSAGDIKIDIEF